jgi:hypothetical protein
MVDSIALVALEDDRSPQQLPYKQSEVLAVLQMSE